MSAEQRMARKAGRGVRTALTTALDGLDYLCEDADAEALSTSERAVARALRDRLLVLLAEADATAPSLFAVPTAPREVTG